MPPELVEMLQRLEKVMQTIGPKESDRPNGTLPPDHLLDDHRNYDLVQPARSDSIQGKAATKAGVEASKHNEEVGIENPNPGPVSSRAKPPSASLSHGESPGKIVRDHGRDTYVRRWFWDDGSSEVSGCWDLPSGL